MPSVFTTRDNNEAMAAMQTMKQFMDQVTPQLQQLGVDPMGYKGYAQAYQSAVNNNLAIPQDFADVMYKFGGYGNTGKQLFEPDKDGNPRLTQEGVAYASQNLPEGVAVHQGFFDFGRQVNDLAKSKGDDTFYKSFPQQLTAAAGYGMEIPQHIQDLAYAGGFKGVTDPQALYKQGFSGGQKLFTPREGKDQGIYTDAGRAYASQNLPEGMSLSDAFYDYSKGSYDFLTQQGATDIPQSIIERSKIAEAAGYQTPQYIKDMMYAAGINPAQTSNNAAPTPTPAASTPTSTTGATTALSIGSNPDDYFDVGKFKAVQAALGSAASDVDIDRAVNYFKLQGNNAPSLEDFENYLSKPQGSSSSIKYSGPQESSNAPEFLANFKKQLQEKTASDTPATRGGTYAELTGDTSTKGGRNRPNSASGPKPRENVFENLVNNLEESRNNRGSSSLRQTIENVTERPVSREELQEARSRYARDSRRFSGRRGSRSGRARSNSDSKGTSFGPGRAKRDSSRSSYSDSRRDRSFERRGRPSRNRFGR